MTHPSHPGPEGPDRSLGPDDGADVRRMLQARSRAVTPRGTFMDIQERIAGAEGARRRHRTLVSAAAAVLLVVLVAGALALTSRDDDREQVDMLDPPATSVTTTTEEGPTTTRMETTTTTSEATTTTEDGPDPTGATDPSDTTGAAPIEADPISEETTVRIDGIGPISVPMTVAEAAAATGQPIAVDPASIIDESSGCRFAQDPSLPGIWYMVDRDRIVRVDITGQGSPNRTDAGVGVGSTKAEVLAAYPGRVTEEPHPYAMDEDSRNLVVTDPAHPGHSITFSVHQGAVVDYRVGLADWVAMPEGCA